MPTLVLSAIRDCCSFRTQEEGQCAETGRQREVRRRAQAGANAWRAVEGGVMADRRI